MWNEPCKCGNECPGCKAKPLTINLYPYDADNNIAQCDCSGCACTHEYDSIVKEDVDAQD